MELACLVGKTNVVVKQEKVNGANHMMVPDSGDDVDPRYDGIQQSCVKQQ
jgi:hypothetical protein